MPINFNDLKTTNASLYPRVGGKPAMKLDVPENPVDQLVDQVALLNRTILPADETAPDPEVLVVGVSPYVYICGTAPERIYISGGIVTSIEKWSVSEDDWVLLTYSAYGAFDLVNGQQLRVSYDSVPRMVKDISNFNNAAGVTEELTPEASPWTITAGGRAANVYISGGGINSIKRNGVDVSSPVLLPRGGSVVIDYTAAPRVVMDS